ncbi:hypothetical protein AB0D22_07630 [Kitasatospora sp. NPDC048538]|uniref:hypothetical protein n=1 Tax=Kitasatospora sp. NPDC048538 TaxID=3155633 RepID=UPI0033FC8636
MPLSDQHAADLTSSYYVLFDTAHVWNDIPGQASVLAVHVERDLAAGAFEVDFTFQPLVAMAQRWLVERGADPARFTDLVPITAADRETERVEDLLRAAGPDRFTVHDQYTYDAEPYDIWVIATDTLAVESDRPVRVFHEQRQVDADTYTLREGHFATIDDAQAWTADPSSPLPQASPSPSARAAAARHTTAATGSVVSATPPLPPPGPSRRRAR